MTREKGIELVTRFDGNYDAHLVDKFCEFIDISIDDFWGLIDKYANKELFERIDKGNYLPKFKVGIGLEAT